MLAAVPDMLPKSKHSVWCFDTTVFFETLFVGVERFITLVFKTRHLSRKRFFLVVIRYVAKMVLFIQKDVQARVSFCQAQRQILARGNQPQVIGQIKPWVRKIDARSAIGLKEVRLFLSLLFNLCQPFLVLGIQEFNFFPMFLCFFQWRNFVFGIHNTVIVVCPSQDAKHKRVGGVVMKGCWVPFCCVFFKRVMDKTDRDPGFGRCVVAKKNL